MAFAQRRVGQSLAILLAGFLALAAFSLFTARPGDAASTWVVTFSSGGASPTAIKAAKGDAIVFKNELPLEPLTGLLAPVNVKYGGEQFDVGGAPVARTVTRSTKFSGSYVVVGLIPLTTFNGSVTMAKAAPPAPPPAGGGRGGGVPPPRVTVPPVNPPYVALPRIPAGDPGTVTGTAVTKPGTAAAATPPQSVVIAPPNSAQKASASGRSLVSSGSPSSAFGLAALTGVVLLLGVGTALTRAMHTGRGTASLTTA